MSANAIDFVFQIIILILSVVIHEVSHGYAADALGDPTARLQGRLTLNPLKHLDPVGSVIVPAISYFFGGFLFGWAKPVPYNPYNLKPGRWPEVMVALAGPFANLFLAVIFAVLLRFGLTHSYSDNFLYITAVIIRINLLLAVFNLMPVPPLDGSKLLFALFPAKIYRLRNFFERYGFILVIFFIFVLWQFIAPIVDVLFRLLTGLSS